MADVDDDFMAPAENRPSEPSSGGGMGAGRGKDRGKGRGAKISLGKKTTDSNCIVPSCEAKRASQKMFCAPHACSWTGIENQSKGQGQAAMDRVQELKKPCNQADRGRAI